MLIYKKEKHIVLLDEKITVTNMKEFLKRINWQYVIMLLLLVAVVFLFLEIRCLRKTIYSDYNNFYERNYRDYDESPYDFYMRNPYRHHNDFDRFERRINKEIFDSMNREIINMKKDFERLDKEFKNFDRKPSREMRKFVYRPSINNTENSFDFSVKLPRDIDRKDITVDLQEDNLIIKIEKNIKDKDSSFSSSFFESYSLPETKATLKDVKVDYKKGELKISVPIIK